MAQILTKQQKQTLELIASTPLSRQFYFSGGTALSYYYLQHRKSEDLDFFNFHEFDPQEITIALKTFRSKLNFQSFDFQASFNRNLYFLKFADNYILKLEFTYYPFPQIEKPTEKDGLLIDSLFDIAVNKLFTLVQKPRGRDYFDLYTIISKYRFSIEDLRLKAKQKFDWDVDVLQLASRLNEVSQHLDDPIVEGKFDRNQVVSFFENQALGCRDGIVY